MKTAFFMCLPIGYVKILYCLPILPLPPLPNLFMPNIWRWNFSSARRTS